MMSCWRGGRRFRGGRLLLIGIGLRVVVGWIVVAFCAVAAVFVAAVGWALVGRAAFFAAATFAGSYRLVTALYLEI